MLVGKAEDAFSERTFLDDLRFFQKKKTLSMKRSPNHKKKKVEFTQNRKTIEFGLFLQERIFLSS